MENDSVRNQPYFPSTLRQTGVRNSTIGTFSMLMSVIVEYAISTFLSRYTV